MGDTCFAVLGKKKNAAPTPPAAMAMLRGVKNPDMLACLLLAASDVGEIDRRHSR